MVGGIFALLVFLLLFGVKILVAFSLLVDNLRGTTPKDPQQTQVIILPPVLDPLPEATNSAAIPVSGKAKGEVTVLLYVNEKQSEETKPETDGAFKFPAVALKEGTNVISAKATDGKNTSELSEVYTTILKKGEPKLEISAPSDNAELSGEKQQTTVTGTTDSENTVRINDRIVVVRSDGSFSYDLPLSEGEQTIIIIAKDPAGNETKIERKVKFKK